ncbi:MAG: transcriptional repressor NrdR [Planctomycetota bacterium]|jgi:transcriptional repressor NrdR
MRCPYCERDKDKVTDSRPSDSGDAIRRRRECLACGKRFTTYERVERTERLMVVKRDGTRIPFDPEKVMRGLAAACGKRPVPADAKERLVREVEEEMHREYEREVPSLAIGKRVADKLRAIDHVAYIRFASEYYQFSSAGEFQREIDDLAERPAPEPGQPDLFT